MKVYHAISAVQAALAATGITKDRYNEQQKFAFRGIEDVYRAAAPLLAANKLLILPRVMERTATERVNTKGNTLFYVTIRVEFDFVSAEDGSKHTVCTFGEAMDSGDKATNKAMSAALKYACLQTFFVPTEATEDPDASSHEVKSDLLLQLREAAAGGMESLKKAFQDLGGRSGIEAVWREFGKELKRTAAAADKGESA